MRKKDRQSRGFTLIEATLLVVIVGIVGVGAGIGLQAVAKAPAQIDEQLAVSSECVTLMEQMRATPFANLAVQAALMPKTWTWNGKTYTCNVTVASADPGGQGAQNDFDKITVTVGSRSLSCYVVQP